MNSQIAIPSFSYYVYLTEVAVALFPCACTQAVRVGNKVKHHKLANRIRADDIRNLAVHRNKPVSRLDKLEEGLHDLFGWDRAVLELELGVSNATSYEVVRIVLWFI